MGEGYSPSLSLSQYIFKLRDLAVEAECSELDYWDMTLGEVVRFLTAAQKRANMRRREQAQFDYIQAQFLSLLISKCLGGKNEVPSVEEMYPGLFDDEKRQEEQANAEHNKRMNLSAARFMAFATQYNKNLSRGEKNG